MLNARPTDEKYRGSYETSVLRRFAQFANSTHVSGDVEKLFTLIALNCVLRIGQGRRSVGNSAKSARAARLRGSSPSWSALTKRFRQLQKKSTATSGNIANLERSEKGCCKNGKKARPSRCALVVPSHLIGAFQLTLLRANQCFQALSDGHTSAFKKGVGGRHEKRIFESVWKGTRAGRSCGCDGRESGGGVRGESRRRS